MAMIIEVFRIKYLLRKEQQKNGLRGLYSNPMSQSIGQMRYEKRQLLLDSASGAGLRIMLAIS